MCEMYNDIAVRDFISEVKVFKRLESRDFELNSRPRISRPVITCDLENPLAVLTPQVREHERSPM